MGEIREEGLPIHAICYSSMALASERVAHMCRYALAGGGQVSAKEVSHPGGSGSLSLCVGLDLYGVGPQSLSQFGRVSSKPWAARGANALRPVGLSSPAIKSSKCGLPGGASTPAGVIPGGLPS